MNSISAYNQNAYVGSLATDMPAPAENAVTAESENTQISGDSVALQGESEAPEETSEQSKPEKMNLGKKLIGAAATHPKITAAVAGAAAVAVIAPAVANGVSVGQAAGLAKDFVVMTGAAERFQTFTSAANLIGVNTAAGALVGASGMAWMATYKGVAGTKGIVEGVKNHDAMKLAKGVRKTSSGVKKALTAGAVASLAVAGTQGVAGAARTLLSPAFKTITTVLHTGVGAITLVNGVKNKDKKAIVDGATSLALGVTTGVAMAVGCAPLAVACTVCSVARDGYETASAVMAGVKMAKEARAEMKQAQAEQGNAPQAKQVDVKPAEGNERQVTESSAETSTVTKAPETASEEVAEVKSDDLEWVSPELMALLNSSPEDAMFVDG